MRILPYNNYNIRTEKRPDGSTDVYVSPMDDSISLAFGVLVGIPLFILVMGLGAIPFVFITTLDLATCGWLFTSTLQVAAVAFLVMTLLVPAGLVLCELASRKEKRKNK